MFLVVHNDRGTARAQSAEALILDMRLGVPLELQECCESRVNLGRKLSKMRDKAFEFRCVRGTSLSGERPYQIPGIHGGSRRFNSAVHVSQKGPPRIIM